MALTSATPPALAGKSIVMNIHLTGRTASSMASGEAPALYPRLLDSGPDARGWIVHNAADPGAPQLMLGHVTRHANGGRPLAMRWGLATRRGDAYAFEEKMRGACRLATPEELK